MTLESPVHPVDKLAARDKYRIHYRRVVDLAVDSGLLASDPRTPVGHFAFSPYYHEGRKLELLLQQSIRRFEFHHPDVAEKRREMRDRIFHGAVLDHKISEPEERDRHLILIGATRMVWPMGTSFVLTYPWDLDGIGRPVGFRKNLDQFSRRRIMKRLGEAGIECGPSLFDDS